MRKKVWISILLMVAFAALGAVLFWKPHLFRQHAEKAAVELPKPKDEYYCPMHPQQRSDKPDNCPICSMKMVKLEKPGTQGHHPAMPGAEPPSEATATPSIFISPERQQLIGVKTAVVERKPLAREIRTAGRIVIDETKLTHIHTKISGFIEEVFVDYVGKPVKKGEPLFTIYSPELLATQEEFLLALRSNQILKDSSFEWVGRGSNNLLEAARRRLRLWDISEAQIDEIEKTGKPRRALTIYSPVNGIVTERAAYHHGRTVTPEMDLYTIVDLSTVWIHGEVYEYELPYLQIGQPVRIELPFAGAARERSGRIIFITPTVEPKTRTAQVRIELPNPDLSLRPDMYVTFKARIGFGSPLVVPADAVRHGDSAIRVRR